MADQPAATYGKPKRKGGRPTRAEATAKALAAIGVDPGLINPMSILASIAADVSAAPTARVMACRTLLAGTKKPKGTRRSKRTIAERAAARAGGVRSGWGGDLQ